MIYLGLEKYGQLKADDLQRVFVNADIVLAEIDHGLNSYKELEKRLGKVLLALSVNESAQSDDID